MSMDKKSGFIRSYVRRRGRITLHQSQALQDYWEHFGITAPSDGMLDFDKIFGRSAEKVLEIGFGKGESLSAMALNAPEKDFIAIEVYEAGVGNLLSLIHQHQLSNIRIFFEDAVKVLEKHIPADSLSTIQIFFADPWPKVRHHKRRLIQPHFVHLIEKKLKTGGMLHLATDWMDYAYQMMEVLSNTPSFANVAGTGLFATRPLTRPMTKFEQRGIKLGHQTWDLIFKRVSINESGIIS